MCTLAVNEFYLTLLPVKLTCVCPVNEFYLTLLPVKLTCVRPINEFYLTFLAVKLTCVCPVNKFYLTLLAVKLTCVCPVNEFYLTLLAVKRKSSHIQKTKSWQSSTVCPNNMATAVYVYSKVIPVRIVIKIASTKMITSAWVWNALQARNDVRTNPEPIFYLFGAEPILNQFWTNLMTWFVRPPFGYGSHTYVRIRSHFGSAEPILNQKCLLHVTNRL